jgi:hypothetical protein
MSHDYRSPLDHEEKLMKFVNPHNVSGKAHTTFSIPPTDAPIDYIEAATDYLEAELANPESPIHQDPKLSTPPTSDDAPPKPLKTADDVFNAARIWLKCPLDHAIIMRYRTELAQRNGYLGDGLVTLYYENFLQTTRPRMVMIINWLHPNTLDGIVEGNVIDRKYVDKAQALDCAYVAICDYDHLVLLKFGPVSGPDRVRVTAVPRDLMRLAFLGFLLEACDTVLGEPGNSL